MYLWPSQWGNQYLNPGLTDSKAYSTNGAGKVGYPCAKEGTWTLTLYHILQKLTKSGPYTAQ